MDLDCWFDFFELSEEAELHASDLRHAGLNARLFWPNTPIQVTPCLVYESMIARQSETYSLLFDALLQLPDVLFDGDYPKFAEAVGFCSASLSDLLTEPGDGLLPCRWDLCQRDSQWFAFEANFGGALGGLPTDEMQALYDALPLPDGQFCDSWASAGQSIAQSFVRRFGAADKWQLVVVDDANAYQDSPLTAKSAARLMSRHLGQDIEAIAHTDLDEFAKTVTKPLVAFELFTLSDIAKAADDSYGPYLSRCADGTLQRGISLLCDLYMSKACLALLHEAADRKLYDPSTCAAIHSAIPKTVVVSADKLTDLRQLPKDRYVLKSAIGYGGNAVFCGWEQPSDRWAELLQDAGNLSGQNGLCVLQHRVEGERAPSLSFMPDGIWIESDAPQVLGIFQIDGQLCGGAVRQAITGDGVANAARRASIGVIRRVSG